jgi:regulator of protease activity HflC (stomatin/prohibitin superfamily)
VLQPGTHWLVAGLDSLRVERFALEQPAFTHALADYLMTRESGVLQLQVPEHGAGILWVDGKVERLLAPGSYAFWKFNRNVSVELVDLRLQALEVSGQEILTRDKVALRLNLSATWRYTDVLKAYEELAKPADHLYRELQFGLRAAVGTRTLDELLENKSVIDEVVTAQATAKLAGYGLQLDGVGVKDIVLPGEMKTILAQVVEAGKAAEANVIRRRMKELETLERVAERIDKISVFGGLDQVLNGLVKLR